MKHGKAAILTGIVAAVCGLYGPAGAMTLKECSALYQAAKSAGTLNGRNWTAFRAAECAPADAGGKGGQPQAQVPPKTGDPTTGDPTTAEPATGGAGAGQQPASLAASADALFPAAIDPKYAAEKPTRGRMHSCVDAYRAAKKAGRLNGLRWIQKGGGFYSQCNRRLKASARS